MNTLSVRHLFIVKYGDGVVCTNPLPIQRVALANISIGLESADHETPHLGRHTEENSLPVEQAACSLRGQAIQHPSQPVGKTTKSKEQTAIYVNRIKVCVPLRSGKLA